MGNKIGTMKDSTVHAKLLPVGWCVLVVLLCAAPCGATTVAVGETLDLHGAVADGYVMVLGTLNLYPGAHVEYYVYALGGTINIYAGELGNYGSILIFDGDNGYPDPIVTVYGTGFALDGARLDPSVTEFIYAIGDSTVLTGTYENGDPVILDFWFFGGVPVHLSSSAVREVAIDIKPGSDTNPINLKSKGLVPVAVLTTDGFAAAAVDPQTVLLAGVAPLRWTMEDVDGDGDKDMLFHFKTEDLATVLTEDSTEATLAAQMTVPATSQSAGQTNNRSPVSGTDKVRIVSSKE
jgi:hypothetical protein